MEGNKLITIPDKAMPNLSRIVYENGGMTPDILLGLYTGYTMAKKAIDAYEALKPVHEPQVYAHQKTITDEEEAQLYLEVEEKVAKENEALEAKKNGEEVEAAIKDEDRTEHVRQGADNRGEPLNIS